MERVVLNAFAKARGLSRLILRLERVKRLQNKPTNLEPKARLPLYRINPPPRDSAECNSILLRTGCRVRQVGADDQNTLPATSRGAFAYETVSSSE